MCPKASDPLSSNTNARQFSVEWKASKGTFSGHIVLTFMRENITWSANIDRYSESACSNAFKGHPALDSVACSLQERFEASKGGRVLVSLDSFPIHPHENNLLFHNGNPSLSEFACHVVDDNQELRGIECKLRNVQTQNIKGSLSVNYLLFNSSSNG